MCNGVYVENEFHILLRCSKYNKNREKYIPEYLRSRPNMESLFKILTTNDTTLVKNTVAFTNEVMSGRGYQ